jgi:thiol-disulfide isomerase/thioredoxin
MTLAQNAWMSIISRLRVLVLGFFLAAPGAPATAEPPGPGDVPPPVLGLTPDGDKVSVPDYAGKAVIVTFWATWCPYCIKELPILENVQNRAGKDRIAVIAVNTESREVFKRAARLMNASMHLTLVHDVDGDAQKAYGVNTLPHMVIIGRDGRILRVWHGYAEDRLGAIADDINQALAPPR